MYRYTARAFAVDDDDLVAGRDTDRPGPATGDMVTFGPGRQDRQAGLHNARPLARPFQKAHYSAASAAVCR